MSITILTHTATRRIKNQLKNNLQTNILTIQTVIAQSISVPVTKIYALVEMWTFLYVTIMNIYCKVVNDVNLTVILLETIYFSISYFFNKFCFIDFKWYTRTGIKWECKSCFHITKTLISEYELCMWYTFMAYLPLWNDKQDEVILGDDSFIIYFHTPISSQNRVLQRKLNYIHLVQPIGCSWHFLSII